jgi:hypothetical protein
MTITLLLLFCLSDYGVIIVDNVLFYKGDLKTGILNTGDVVEIIGRSNDKTKIMFDGVKSELLKDVLIDFKEEIAEEKLFVFARGYFDETEYRKAVRLFNVFIKNFSKSKYVAEVLYYYGLSSEGLIKNLQKPDTSSDFLFNESHSIWYYSGKAYNTIIGNFPQSIFASKAAYQLLKIYRLKNLPWCDSIQLIQDELNRWYKFILKYENSEEYVLGLLEIGFLNRVLFEITDKDDYRRKAIKVFEKIISEHPDSIYSAQSRVNLYEIEKGKAIYKY